MGKEMPNPYEASTDVEKLEALNEIVSQLTSPCRSCLACAGRFVDGESIQSAYNRLVIKK